MIRKGTIVRLRYARHNKQTARVLATSLVFGNTTVRGACLIDRRLGGLRYWHMADLIRADVCSKQA